MRRAILVGIVTFSLIGGGCSLLNLPLPFSSQGAVPEADYFPIKTGATWVMQPIAADGPPYWSTTYKINSSTVSVTSVEMTTNAQIGHLNAITREALISGHAEPSPGYSDDSSSLKLIKEASGRLLLSAGTALRRAESLRFTLPPENLRYRESTSHPYPYLQIPSAAGELSLVAPTTVISEDRTYQFSEIRQSTSFEPEVVVAAGRFSDCLKIVISSSTLEEQKPKKHQTTLETVYWLAKGVGIIKKQQTKTWDYDGATPWVSADELATYSIPL